MPEKRHPSAPSPGGSDAPEDAFIARVLALWNWAQRNTQVLVLGGALLVLAVGAGIYYYNYQQNLRSQAAREFEQVQQAVGTGQPETARTELQSFIDRYGETPYGREARLLLAQFQLRTGAPEEAVSTLQPLTSELSEPIALEGSFLLAAAHEEAEQFDAAENVFLRIADAATLSFQIREALAGAAELRAREGNYAGAAQLYERILERHPPDESDPEQAMYELRLAEMRAAQES